MVGDIVAVHLNDGSKEFVFSDDDWLRLIREKLGPQCESYVAQLQETAQEAEKYESDADRANDEIEELKDEINGLEYENDELRREVKKLAEYEKCMDLEFCAELAKLTNGYSIETIHARFQDYMAYISTGMTPEEFGRAKLSER